MPHRRHRLAARFLAISLLAATLYTADSLTFPDTAEARCTGVGNPVRSTFSYAGHLAVSETPVSGTCNGNQLYTGVLKDESRDSFCVAVEFRETGTFWIRVGFVCGKGNTVEFEWRDLVYENSRAYERLCVTREDGSEVACGWGSEIEGFGTNWGY